jgi:formate dehydrogenase iron-sulfur subunit
MQCTNTVCVCVCPTHALVYSEDGQVAINYERCIGYGRCVEYCPFEVPKLGVDNVTPRIVVDIGKPGLIPYKCIWCQDRIKAGLIPACVKTCTTGALQFGERLEIIELATKRVATILESYPDANLYGEHILGGLHVLYVLTESPQGHGLPITPEIGEYPPFEPSDYAKREWYMESDLIPLTIFIC